MTENHTLDLELVLDPVERAIADIALGRAVVVVDDEDRENEGDIVFAASAATAELMAFTIRYSSGVICAPMTGEELDRLKLPPMTQVNEDRKGTAYTVSVDAREGVDTGISAADRARTVRLLSSPGTEPGDLTRPGHVFRCARSRAGCWSAPATPRRPSTWPGSPDCRRPARSPRWSTTTAPWPGCPNWSPSPANTASRSSPSRT